MSSEKIKEAQQRVAVKLNQLENTDDVDVLELTLEELSAISGGFDDRKYYPEPPEGACGVCR